MITVYNKLVRDNIPSVIAASGKKANYRTINTREEFKEQLFNKLNEEVKELQKAYSENDIDGIVEEIADVYEVLNAINTVYDIRGKLYEFRLKKQVEKGTYKKRIFLESVEE